jgi:hypothetical protein
MTDTQTTAILTALREGAELTPLDALRRFGCFRLGARIWDLRHQGHSITSRWVEVNGARVKAYRMGEVVD